MNITSDNYVSQLLGYRSRGVIYVAISNINLIAGPIITTLTFNPVLPITIHPDDPEQSVPRRRFDSPLKSLFLEMNAGFLYNSINMTQKVDSSQPIVSRNLSAMKLFRFV